MTALAFNNKALTTTLLQNKLITGLQSILNHVIILLGYMMESLYRSDSYKSSRRRNNDIIPELGFVAPPDNFPNNTSIPANLASALKNL